VGRPELGVQFMGVSRLGSEASCLPPLSSGRAARVGRAKVVESPPGHEPVRDGKGPARELGSERNKFIVVPHGWPYARGGAVAMTLSRGPEPRRPPTASGWGGILACLGAGGAAISGLRSPRWRSILATTIVVTTCAGLVSGCGSKQASGHRTTTTVRPTVSSATSSRAAVTPSSGPKTTSTGSTIGSIPTPATSGAGATTTTAPAAPPTAAPSTLSPSVTAGTVVPWSPTSPDTLVGATGNPADWPAAQAEPPSLAGAYSTNMMKVIVTLIAYEDWVWSHPDPALVANYMTPGSSAFAREVQSIQKLATTNWHSNPEPTEIDWLRIMDPPRVAMFHRGRAVMVGGHNVYMPAYVNVVLNDPSGQFLNNHGRVMRQWPASGKHAFSVALAQGASGQWRIANINPIEMSALVQRLDGGA